VLGLVIVMLSVTGILIWMKKRRAWFGQQQIIAKRRLREADPVSPSDIRKQMAGGSGHSQN